MTVYVSDNTTKMSLVVLRILIFTTEVPSIAQG